MGDDIKDGAPQPGEGTPPVEEDKAPEPEQKHTDADIQRATEEGRKAGRTESWQHFQGVADKQIREAGTEAGALRTKLAEVEKQQFEALSPEEQQTAMTRRLYDKSFGETGSPQNPPATEPSAPEPAGSVEDAAGQARQQVAEVLKKQGVDPTKVNWGDGLPPEQALETFLGSVAEQFKGLKGEPVRDDESPPVDAARSAAGVADDLTKVDPLAVIVSGGMKRIRGAQN